MAPDDGNDGVRRRRRRGSRQALSDPDRDTIFALSSGQPPAGIAVVRISGSHADAALAALGGGAPEPRRASLVLLREGDVPLDQALAIRFPGPGTVTGEDLVELHLHGGRAVVAGMLAALGRLPCLRAAEPGEFTRRAFANGRIDLAEAEGLADLLQAETEGQRVAALRLAGGELSRLVAGWADRLLGVAAMVEAELDFSDEDDVGPSADHRRPLEVLGRDIDPLLERPPAERMRDGVRVAIAGPPNAGKSTLLNALIGREAAIVSDIAGTTRDVIEAPVAIAGVPFLFLDTAGLRESEDRIEAIGVARAHDALAGADILLWLGAADDLPAHPHALVVHAKADLGGGEGFDVSAVTGAGLDVLIDWLVMEAGALLPVPSELAVNARQRQAIAEARAHIDAAAMAADLLIVAEELRVARAAFDRVTGRAGVEDMLDALFGRFCIGK